MSKRNLVAEGRINMKDFANTHKLLASQGVFCGTKSDLIGTVFEVMADNYDKHDKITDEEEAMLYLKSHGLYGRNKAEKKAIKDIQVSVMEKDGMKSLIESEMQKMKQEENEQDKLTKSGTAGIPSPDQLNMIKEDGEKSNLD